MANGNTLERLEKELEGLLENPDASMRDMVAGCLRVSLHMIPYLQQSQDDHDRTDNLWRVYRLLAWGLAIGGGALITMAATGRLQVIFK